MLLGQDFGGRHEGRLQPGAHGVQHGRHGHDGLAAAHVPLDQPVHRMGARQVLMNVPEHARLRAGEPERQGLQQALRQRRVELVRQAARLPLDLLALLAQRQLEQQEVLEGEPPVPRRPASDQVLQARVGGGKMDGSDRLPERHEPSAFDDGRRQRVHGAARVLVDQRLHDGAHPVARHRPRLGLPPVVDRHNAAHVDQVGMRRVLRAALKDLKDGILHLVLRPSPALRPDQTVEHQPLAGLKRLGQIRLIEPDEMQAAGVIRRRHFDQLAALVSGHRKLDGLDLGGNDRLLPGD